MQKDGRIFALVGAWVGTAAAVVAAGIFHRYDLVADVVRPECSVDHGRRSAALVNGTES